MYDTASIALKAQMTLLSYYSRFILFQKKSNETAV